MICALGDRVREPGPPRADHRAGPPPSLPGICRRKHPRTTTPSRPPQRALDALAENTEDTTALDTLASSDVLVPVPDDANDQDAADPGMLALPVLEQQGGRQVVPVFTSELEMADLLPYVSRYRMVAGRPRRAVAGL